MVTQARFNVLWAFNHDKYSIRIQVDIITGLRDSVKQACVARAALARSAVLSAGKLHYIFSYFLSERKKSMQFHKLKAVWFFIALKIKS